MAATVPRVKRGPGRPCDVQLQERRRREILAVAIRHFAEHGYSNADMQVMADELGVGKGTIYRYFPSKESLFLWAVDQGMNELRYAVDHAASLAVDALDRLRTGIRAYWEYFERNPDVVELLIQERAFFRERKEHTYFVHRQASLGPWRELIQGLIDSGVFRCVPVDRIADVTSDLLYGTMFTNHFSRRKKPLASQCEDVLDILLCGILTRKGSDHAD